MKDEKIIEELFYEASSLGMFNDMHLKVTEIRQKNNKKSYVDCVEEAFNQLIKEKQSQL
jgi:hypothetical protein